MTLYRPQTAIPLVSSAEVYGGPLSSRRDRGLWPLEGSTDG